MPYLFTCPHCQTRTEVEDEFSGESGECVVCGRGITLPPFAPGAQKANSQMAGVRSSSKGKRPVAFIASAVVVLLIVGAGVIAIARVGGTAAQRVSEGRERMASIRNLEKIANALNAYAADHGAYPAPAITNRRGKPLLSWRVLILPYLGEDKLYDQFDLNSPWDNQKNQMMDYQMPAVFRHPSSQGWASDTAYHLVTGTGTLFPSSGPLGPRQVADGATKTLLVVEGRASSSWTEPIDIDASINGGVINAASGNGFGGITNAGMCVATVDGRGHFLSEATPSMTVTALISPRGGEPLPDDVLD